MLDVVVVNTVGNLWIGVAALAFSILTGAIAMAWRLGRLEQKVTDISKKVDKIA